MEGRGGKRGGKEAFECVFVFIFITEILYLNTS